MNKRELINWLEKIMRGGDDDEGYLGRYEEFQDELDSSALEVLYVGKIVYSWRHEGDDYYFENSDELNNSYFDILLEMLFSYGRLGKLLRLFLEKLFSYDIKEGLLVKVIKKMREFISYGFKLKRCDGLLRLVKEYRIDSALYETLLGMVGDEKVLKELMKKVSSNDIGKCYINPDLNKNWKRLLNIFLRKVRDVSIIGIENQNDREMYEFLKGRGNWVTLLGFIKDNRVVVGGDEYKDIFINAMVMAKKSNDMLFIDHNMNYRLIHDRKLDKEDILKLNEINIKLLRSFPSWDILYGVMRDNLKYLSDNLLKVVVNKFIESEGTLRDDLLEVLMLRNFAFLVDSCNKAESNKVEISKELVNRIFDHITPGIIEAYKQENTLLQFFAKIMLSSSYLDVLRVFEIEGLDRIKIIYLQKFVEEVLPAERLGSILKTQTRRVVDNGLLVKILCMMYSKNNKHNGVSSLLLNKLYDFNRDLFDKYFSLFSIGVLSDVEGRYEEGNKESEEGMRRYIKSLFLYHKEKLSKENIEEVVRFFNDEIDRDEMNEERLIVNVSYLLLELLRWNIHSEVWEKFSKFVIKGTDFKMSGRWGVTVDITYMMVVRNRIDLFLRFVDKDDRLMETVKFNKDILEKIKENILNTDNINITSLLEMIDGLVDVFSFDEVKKTVMNGQDRRNRDLLNIFLPSFIKRGDEEFFPFLNYIVDMGVPQNYGDIRSFWRDKLRTRKFRWDLMSEKSKDLFKEIRQIEKKGELLLGVKGERIPVLSLEALKILNGINGDERVNKIKGLVEKGYESFKKSLIFRIYFKMKNNVIIDNLKYYEDVDELSVNNIEKKVKKGKLSKIYLSLINDGGVNYDKMDREGFLKKLVGYVVVDVVNRFMKNNGVEKNLRVKELYYMASNKLSRSKVFGVLALDDKYSVIQVKNMFPGLRESEGYRWEIKLKSGDTENSFMKGGHFEKDVESWIRFMILNRGYFVWEVQTDLKGTYIDTNFYKRLLYLFCMKVSHTKFNVVKSDDNNKKLIEEYRREYSLYSSVIFNLKKKIKMYSKKPIMMDQITLNRDRILKLLRDDDGRAYYDFMKRMFWIEDELKKIYGGDFMSVIRSKASSIDGPASKEISFKEKIEGRKFIYMASSQVVGANVSGDNPEALKRLYDDRFGNFKKITVKDMLKENKMGRNMVHTEYLDMFVYKISINDILINLAWSEKVIEGKDYLLDMMKKYLGE